MTIIVVKVEIHSAVDGAFAHEVARATILEDGTVLIHRGNGARQLKKAMLSGRSYRKGKLTPSRSNSSKSIWGIIARALKSTGFSD